MLFSMPVANMKLAMVQSPFSHCLAPHSAGDRNFRKAAAARLSHEQSAGLRLPRQRLLVEIDARRRDVQAIKGSATKSAAGRPRHRDLDFADALGPWRIAPNAPAIPKN